MGRGSGKPLYYRTLQKLVVKQDSNYFTLQKQKNAHIAICQSTPQVLKPTFVRIELEAFAKSADDFIPN